MNATAILQISIYKLLLIKFNMARFLLVDGSCNCFSRWSLTAHYTTDFCDCNCTKRTEILRCGGKFPLNHRRWSRAKHKKFRSFHISLPWKFSNLLKATLESRYRTTCYTHENRLRGSKLAIFTQVKMLQMLKNLVIGYYFKTI